MIDLSMLFRVGFCVPIFSMVNTFSCYYCMYALCSSSMMNADVNNSERHNSERQH